MIKPKITIVVPIYNVERYLRRCLDSIINQTYSNLEIMLIDDGSYDDSHEICLQYSKLDCRIAIVSSFNYGLSTARNNGLKLAIGEYLIFVDSDDFIDLKMSETLLASVIDSKSDIAICGYYEVEENGKFNSDVCNRNSYFIKKEEAFDKLFSDEHMKYGTAWGKIYKNDLFNNISFPDGHIYEDMYVITEIYKQTEKIYVLDDKLYYYTKRNDSISGSWDDWKILESLLATKKRICFFSNYANYDLIRKSVLLHLNHAINCYSFAKKRRTKNKIKKTFFSVYYEYKATYLNNKEKRIYALFLFSYNLYSLVRKQIVPRRRY